MMSVKIIWFEKDVLKVSPASFLFPPLLAPVFHGKPVGRQGPGKQAGVQWVGGVCPDSLLHWSFPT